MSYEQLYITAHCCIAGGIIYKNEEILFEKNSIRAADFLVAAYKHFHIDYPKFYKMDNLSKLGFLAAELLLEGRDISKEYAETAVGIVLSNANASLDADLAYFESVKNIPSPAQFVYTLPNIVIGEISIRHRLKGENAFFVAAQFDAAFTAFYVQDLFSRKRSKACICGWVEFLGEEYKAVVYLVENRSGERSLPFEIDHIHKIYQLTNGEING